MEKQEIKYYSPKEIAEKLSLAPYTIRKWIRIGKIKGYKIGSRVRVKESDFIKFTETLKKRS